MSKTLQRGLLIVSPYTAFVFGVIALLEIFRIVRFYKGEVIPQPPHAAIELRKRTAIQRARRHDVIARLRNRRQREELRRLPARRRQRRHAIFQRRHALLQHVSRRVHDARIDVAELLQRK